jgi:SAM-dependent methyltransferase
MPGEPTSALARLPDAYRRWRTSRLGQITDAVEEELILVGPPAGLRILDVGCGDAALTVALALRRALVTGVDVDPSMLAAGRARAAASGVAPALMQGDIRALPFADDSFDAVLAVTVLCFVDDAAPAVQMPALPSRWYAERSMLPSRRWRPYRRTAMPGSGKTRLQARPSLS